jgi:hypothetical protein
MSDRHYKQRKKSSAVCRGRTVSVFDKNSVKNSTFVQKETGPSVTLKVNLILILDVNFILVFK